MDMKALKDFDWRALKRYTNPKAMDDLNAFLEGLPKNANKSLLIIAAIIWTAASALGLYTVVQVRKASEISLELEEEKALLPIVPKIQDSAVSAREVNDFVENLQMIYKDLEIKANGANIIIRSKTTANFGQFREAIGHVQNGGVGWRVNVDKLCVGKECNQFPLFASLKINTVSVEGQRKN